MKTPKLLVALFVLVLVFAVAAPVAAQGVTPSEPSGPGTFCAGTGPLVFESVIPGSEWKCTVDGTYTDVQPWHSPGGPYNPNLRIDGMSWDKAIGYFDSEGLNSGSIWFVPTKASAPAAPSQPDVGLANWSNWWPWPCLGLLGFFALIGSAFLLGRRNRDEEAEPPPAPPATK
ncbi:MAG: hypothetical protein UY49_C0002G0006 [Microgenomates group bacterium GW2011_GWC1_49_7]|nr:MAG: hypothetical protein UY49_C0002G0006 [Microgenomates group bacterium GW2011_GWC1_49_7]